MPFCTKCSLDKPTEQFALRTIVSGKRHSRCKTCQAESSRARYQRVRVEALAYSKARKPAKKAALRVWMAELKNKPCMDCGNRYPPWCMDYDHRDGTTKLHRGVSDMSSNRLSSKRMILEEIAKCDLVCANCHRTRTHNRQLEKYGPLRA